jgi:hypothetical protein
MAFQFSSATIAGMSILSEIPSRQPRRGEVDRVLPAHTRRMLHEIHAELVDLHRRATLIHDDFLALLIATAADEARDQLRDDLILREAQAEGDSGEDMQAGEG